MKNNELSDESLIFLHRKEKINGFVILYERYRNYGYAIVTRILKHTPYFTALCDEKETIIFEALTKALNIFEESKGSFKCLLSKIIENMTFKYITEFSKNPLSDYVSLDQKIDENGELTLVDTLVFKDSGENPNEYVDKNESDNRISNLYRGKAKKDFEKMFEMKMNGFSYDEIAECFNLTSKAVSSIFYRVRKKMRQKNSKVTKK